MTVRELIAHLSTLPPDLPVMTDGYEGGTTDVLLQRVYIAKVAMNHHGTEDSYYGKHQELMSDDSPAPTDEWDQFYNDAKEGRIIDAVIIARGDRF